jgi:hypothetical protein
VVLYYFGSIKEDGRRMAALDFLLFQSCCSHSSPHVGLGHPTFKQRDMVLALEFRLTDSADFLVEASGESRKPLGLPQSLGVLFCGRNGIRVRAHPRTASMVSPRPAADRCDMRAKASELLGAHVLTCMPV